MESVRSYISIVASSRALAGRLLHYAFRGMRSAHVCYDRQTRQVALAALCIGSFSNFVASTAASIATGRSEPTPGQNLHPLRTSVFSGRTTQ